MWLWSPWFALKWTRRFRIVGASPSLQACVSGLLAVDGCQLVRQRVHTDQLKIAYNLTSGPAPVMAAKRMGRPPSLLRCPTPASIAWCIGDHGTQQVALLPAPRVGQGSIQHAQHIFPGHVGP